jgi:hypothetical protein
MDGATIETVKARAARVARGSATLAPDERAVVGIIERGLKKTA